MSLVDVIIPVYNSPLHWLKTAINSVLAQTVNDYQIVIINDGSSPLYKNQLVEYISYLNSDKLLLLHRNEKGGPPAARNFGIAASSSKYVAFLDSDDSWLPHKLESQLNTMLNGKDYSLIHSDVRYIDETGTLIAPNSSIPKQKFNNLDRKDLILYLLRSNKIETLSVMVTRDSLNHVGCFDENLQRVQDWDLWLRYAISGEPMYYDNQVLASYRKHQWSISQDYELVLQSKKRLLGKTFQELEKKDKTLITSSFKNSIYRKAFKTTGRRFFNSKNYEKAREYFKLSREFGFDYDCLRREFKCILKSWLISL